MIASPEDIAAGYNEAVADLDVAMDGYANALEHYAKTVRALDVAGVTFEPAMGKTIDTALSAMEKATRKVKALREAVERRYEVCLAKIKEEC